MAPKVLSYIFGGRIRGANIARSEKFQTGTVPLSSVKADIDFASVATLTRSGYVEYKSLDLPITYVST